MRTREDRIVWRRSLGAAVVLGPGGASRLEGPAAVVWELLEHGLDDHELVATVADAYGLSHGDSASAVQTVLDDLTARGLLARARRNEPAPPDPPRPAQLDLHPSSDDPIATLAAWAIDPSVRIAPQLGEDWNGLLQSVRRERLVGVLAKAVERSAIEVSESARSELAEVHQHVMVLALQIERLLLEVTDGLREGGVEPLVIKGPAIAHRHFVDPSMRQFGDIDLLLRAEDLERSYQLLTDLGLRRRIPQHRPGFDQRYGKGATFLTEDGLEVDVHRTFAEGAFGITARPDEAFVAPDVISVGGATFRTPSAPITLVALCLHAMLGTRLARISNLLDVAKLIAVVEPAEAIDIAERWRCEVVLAMAVRATDERFGLPSDHELVSWAADHRGPLRQRVALTAYRSRRRSYGLQILSALPAIDGVRGRVDFLRALLVPDRAFVDDRQESQVARWRRVVGDLVRSEPRC